MNQVMNTEAVNLPMLVVGVALAVLSIAALVVLRRRRHHVDPVAVEPEALQLGAEDELMEMLDLEDTEMAAMSAMVELLQLNAQNDATESATVRALRAQVRTLEQALEVAPEQSSPVPAAITAAVEQSYKHQVLLAVRAVASRTGDDDDPRHAAARVVAAVERLDEDGFARPVLPGVATRTVAVPPPLPPAQTAAVAPTPAPPVLPAASEPEPVAIVDEVEPVLDEEVVVPVPPPAAEEPKRSRRRIRRSAA